VLLILNINKYLLIYYYYYYYYYYYNISITGAVPVHATKEHERENVWLHLFLTSATDIRQVSFTPWPLYPEKGAPKYPLNRWLVEPHSRSMRFGKEISRPCRESNYNPSVCLARSLVTTQE